MSDHRRWPWIVGAAAVVLVALAVGLVLVVRHGREPGEASVDEAVESFRTGTSDTTSPSATNRPDPGVYLADGSGSEKLSFQAGAQSIGPTLPITVTPSGADCFTVQVDFNANHWQTWDYCESAGELTNTGGRVFQRFDFVVMQPEATAVSVCDPPALVLRDGMTAGDSWDQSCTSTTEGSPPTVSAGPHRVLGLEDLDIGGTPVQAWRVRDERTVTGGQTGTSSTDTWFAVDTGLPLQITWTMSLDSDSIIGRVTYSEQGTWTLSSLAPQR